MGKVVNPKSLRFQWRKALESPGIVAALMANCFAYWVGASPPGDFLDLFSSYARLQV
jgi:hypothetical protein